MTEREARPAADVGRVLVVEDSPSARRLLQDVLLRLGVELPNLRMSGTVAGALTTFSQWQPDLTFVDVELKAGPHSALPAETAPSSADDPKDGAELARLFLARDPNVRVILCSAADPSDPRVAELVKEGKVSFLLKPLLAARVEEVLATASSERLPRRR